MLKDNLFDASLKGTIKRNKKDEWGPSSTAKVINKVFLTVNEFIKLALVGLISLFIIQTFIHLGVNTRLLPTTGMTLPFLSYGGSSLIGSAIVAGVILNFTKNTPRKI